MYREWLAKMLEGAPRGTRARLAERLGLSGDMVSKMLSGIRDITADELRQIALFFETMPPGFDGLPQQAPIRDEREILAFLSRVEGLGDRGVDLAMMTIQTALEASAYPRSEQPGADDQSAPANRRREYVPSQRR